MLWAPPAQCQTYEHRKCFARPTATEEIRPCGWSAAALAAVFHLWHVCPLERELGLSRRDYISGMAQGRSEHHLPELFLYGDVRRPPCARSAAGAAGGPLRIDPHQERP